MRHRPPDGVLVVMENSPMCPVSLTRQYFGVLGAGFQGFVQPACKPRHPKEPHPSRAIGYSNALKVNKMKK